ncbi:MAG TPA: hypothetical protein VFT49_02540 [Candidatus Saccharimonadales bacterium]|nr:hypothetical protein [Candidatus Saccharimonadales bacterium]
MLEADIDAAEKVAVKVVKKVESEIRPTYATQEGFIGSATSINPLPVSPHPSPRSLETPPISIGNSVSNQISQASPVSSELEPVQKEPVTVVHNHYTALEKPFRRHIFEATIVLLVVVIAGAVFSYFNTRSNQANLKAQSETIKQLASSLNTSNFIQNPSKQSNLNLNVDTVVSDGKKLTATGQVAIQNEADSTHAFTVQSSAGKSVLTTDTTNGRVGIGQDPTGSAALQVGGDITASGDIVSTGGKITLDSAGLHINNVLVCTSNGCISSTKSSATPPHTIDVGDVAFLSQNQTLTGNNTFKGSAVFAGAFQVQDTSGNSLIAVDSANSKVGVNTTPNASGADLQVGGDINVSGVYRVGNNQGANLTCPAGDIIGSPVIVGGIIIGGSCQTNLAGSVPTFQQVYNTSSNPHITLNNASGTLTVQDAASPLGINLFVVQNNGGGTKYFAVNSSGARVVGDIDITGQYKVNGSPLTSSALADTSNIAKLNATQTFTGASTFSNAANSFTGEGSGLNNVNASQLNGQAASYYTNASNISTGTLGDSHLSNNVALRSSDQTFSGANTFSNGGNSFTGNGSGLTALNGSNISSGTINDARLSGNVALKNGNNTFTGNNTFVLSTGPLQVQDASTPLGTDLFEVTDSTGATKYFAVNSSGATISGYDVCTSQGNCAGVGGDVTSSGGTLNHLAKFSAGNAIADSLILDDGTSVTIGGDLAANNITQNGHQVCDTSGNCVGGGGAGSAIGGSGTAGKVALFTDTGTIGDSILSQSGTTVTAGGSINATGQYQLNGSQVSSSILSNDGNLAKLDADQTFTGVNLFNNASNVFVGDGSGLTALNGSNITSGTVGDAYLSNNVALLNANQTFTGANTFNNVTNSFTGDGSNLTNLNGSNIASGTVADGRLSNNVALLNANQTASGNKTFTGTVAVNSTGIAAFSIQNSGGAGNLFVADTTDTKVGIATAPSSSGATLQVGGNISATTGFVANGNTGSSVSCSSGNVLQNAVVTGGIITGGTCVANGAGVSVSLQQAYNSSSPANITLNSTNGGLTVQDNSTPLGSSLFTVEDNGASTKYLDVSASGVVASNLTTTNTLTANGAATLNNTATINNQGTGGNALTVNTDNQTSGYGISILHTNLSGGDSTGGISISSANTVSATSGSSVVNGAELNISRSVTTSPTFTSSPTLDTSATNGDTSATVTVGNHLNRYLILINVGDTVSQTYTCTGGQTMALIGHINKIWAYGLINPPTGSVNCSRGGGGSTYSTSLSSWYNVDQTTPVGTLASTTTHSLTLSSVVNQAIIDAWYTSATGNSYSPTSGQTLIGASSSSPYPSIGSSYSIATGLSTTVSWSAPSFSGYIALPINPAGALHAAATLSGNLSQISSNCVVNDGTCSDTSTLLNLNQQYAGATGTILNIQNAGSGMALQVQNASSVSLLAVDTNNSNISLGQSTSGALSAWLTNANSLPQALRYQSSIAANGYVYVLGGYNSSAIQSTVYYAKLNADGSTGSWQTNANALPQARAEGATVVVGGYIYYIAGYTGSNQSSVYYAKLNSDGSVGSWSTSANNLPQALALHSAVTLNGYVYVLGGLNGTPQSTVYYAKVNQDGSLGSWSTNTNVLPQGLETFSAVAANGYIYTLGGYNSGGKSTVYYAKLNADGSTGTWQTNTNALPAISYDNTSVTVNGYIYVLGGYNSGVQSVVYYAKINSDNSLGSWTTASNALPSARYRHSSIVYNGYIYALGGYDSGSTVQSTVYYASVSGMTRNSGQESIADQLTVGNGLTVAGNTTFQPTADSTTAFSIQNSTGGSLFNIDSLSSAITLDGNTSGQLGAWQANSNSLPATRAYATSVVANGYVYELGGFNGGSGLSTVYYAKLNADGSTGTWQTNTNALPQGLLYASSFASNGYIYEIGGQGNGTGCVSSTCSTVYYAKLNADGSTGTWQTNTNALPQVLKEETSVTANGYAYVIGGYDGTNKYATVYYAKLNADGSTGAWQLSANALPQAIYNSTSIVANGYAYEIGGCNSIGCSLSTVYYAKLNADGSTGTWQTNTNALPQARNYVTSVVNNGYIYAMGGGSSTVYYAKLNADGSTGTWQTNTNALPQNLLNTTSVMANGYVYQIGGVVGGSYQSTVYYASTSRVSVGANLDLIGLQGGDGTAGGSLTANNITAAGNLQVDGSASVANGLNVVGAVAVQAGSSNSTSQFSIQNSSGSNLLNADTSNMRVAVNATYSLTTAPTFSAATLQNSPAAPTVTATGTTGSSTYAYEISAVTSQGLVSVPSSAGSTTSGNAILDSNSYNAISWSAVTGASTYNIYRTSSNGSPLTTGLIGSTSSTSFNDPGLAASGTVLSATGLTNATTYYYKITAIDGTGGETAASSEKNVTTTAAGQGVVIRWLPVTGATSYRIYRGTSTGSETGYYVTAGIYNLGSLYFIDNGSTQDNTTSTPPTTGNAYNSANSSNSNLQLSVGGNGTPTGQLYVSGSFNGVTSATYVGGSPQGIVVQGKYAYLTDTTNNKFEIFNVSVPSSPLFVSSISTVSAPYHFAIAGHYAYIAGNSSSSLQIVDISNPAQPSIVSTATTHSSVWEIAVQGKYVYLTENLSYNLEVFDVSNPASPIEVSLTSINNNPRAVAISGRYLYLLEANTRTLLVFDISNPSLPVSVSSLTMSSGGLSLQLSGNYAYTDGGIIDISNPYKPTLVTSIPPVAGYRAAIQSRYAYSVSSSSFYVYDISSPSNPFTVGNINIGGSASHVSVSGRYAYIANSGSHTLQVIDLGGAYLQQLEAGGAELGSLQVDSNAQILGDSNVQGSATVGQNLQVGAGLNVSGTTSLQGGVVLGGGNNQLAVPSVPTVTPIGSISTKTYGYVITAINANGGETASSALGTTTSGFTTLSGTNYNTISWTPVSGAAGYKIYRKSTNGNPSTTGYIGYATATSFNDTGLTATGSAPAIDTSGQLTVEGSALFANTINSTTAFQVQDSSGNQLFNVDTANSAVSTDALTINVGGANTAHSVHIGDGGLGTAYVFPQNGVIDNFNRTNNASLGANWAGPIDPSASNTWQVNSNQALDNHFGSGTDNYRTNISAANTEAYFTIEVPNEYLVWARIKNPNTSNFSGYSLDWESGSFLGILKTVNGTTTVLATGTAATQIAGNRMGISVVGSTITAYIDTGSGWVQAAQATDSSVVGVGTIGISAVSQNDRIDDFGGGAVIPTGTNESVSIGSASGSSSLMLQAGAGNINIGALGSTIIKPVNDSQTAFQIQNSTGGALFTGDTTSMLVNIDSSARLTFDGGASNEAIFNASGALIVGNYAGNIQVQTNTFEIQNTTDYKVNFGLDSNGDALFQNSSDSPTALQIQNAGNTPLFTADTSGMSITIGGGLSVSGNVAVGGYLITDGGMYATSLPGSPVNGQEIYYDADPSHGVVWHLRYNSTSGYWEFLGGSPLYVFVSTNEQVGSTGSWVNLSTANSITIPLAGDYAVTAGANATNTANNASAAAMGVSIGDTSPTIEDDTNAYVLNSSISSHMEINPYVFTGLSSGSVLKIRYLGTNTTVGFKNRGMWVTPIRVQ